MGSTRECERFTIRVYRAMSDAQILAPHGCQRCNVKTHLPFANSFLEFDHFYFIGHLDDLIPVPILVYFGVKLIPVQVMEDCRRSVSGKDQERLN
jgi:hypothetical protein